MTGYNGHRSWNAWNVSLWINNTEPIYRIAMEYCQEGMRKYDNKDMAIEHASRKLFRDYLAGCRTPDGATYNFLTVKLAIADYLD